MSSEENETKSDASDNENDAVDTQEQENSDEKPVTWKDLVSTVKHNLKIICCFTRFFPFTGFS